MREKVHKGAHATTANTELTPPPSGAEALQNVLQEKFGLKEFKPQQLEVIQQILSGKNIFISMPTSWGKSLCYQLPAVVSKMNGDGLTIVVSPLIALMRDQIDGLTKRGIVAVALNSENTEEQESEAIDRLFDRTATLLYVSPERLASQRFQQLIKKFEVARLVVDEAHCVSMWGHDFRPSYQRIPDVREMLGKPQLVALTATAPVVVRNDILEMLRIPGAEQINGDPDRKNLSFDVVWTTSEEALEDQLFQKLKVAAKRNESVVVYCPRVTDCEGLSARLEENLGISSRIFHAQMPKVDKNDSYTLFMEGVTKILFATKAFGLGIDKPDIRDVFHYGVPDSLESYYQEAGRAGRDGKPAQCTLFTCSADMMRAYKRVAMENPSITTIDRFYHKLWSWVKRDAQNESQPSISFSLDRWAAYAQIKDPARKILYHTAMSVMQEFKLIQFNSNWVTFLQKPEDFPGGVFPISEDILNAKNTRDRARQHLMLNYANSEDPRQLLMNHFRHNTAMAELSPEDFMKRCFTFLETQAVIKAVAQKDWEFSDLSAALRDEKRFPKSEFLDHTARDMRAILEAMNDWSYIRLTRIDKQTFVTLGERGEENLMGDDRWWPAQTLPILLRHIHHSSSLDILKEGLKDWFDMTITFCRNREANSWWRRLEEFASEKFEILGQEITGQKLLEAYFARSYTRVKKTNPIKSHTKDLLNALFNDQISF